MIKPVGSLSYIWLLLGSAFILRVLLAPFGTLLLDHNTFVAWSTNLAQNGFAHFYDSWSDYLPGYLYILYLLGKINAGLSGVDTTILFKLPAILADVATGFLIYKATFKILKKEKLALISSAIYLFNPAVFANSSLWGQVDGVVALLTVAALFFARGKPILAAVSLGVGTLVKLQAIFIAPIIFLLWLNKSGVHKTAGYILVAGLVFLFGFIPFASERPLLPFVFERLQTVVSQYPYTSVNAFNLWAFGGRSWQPDTIGFVAPREAGILLFMAFVLLGLGILLNRKRQKTFAVAALIFVASFLFLTRMHERHLLFSLAPLSIASVMFPPLFIPYVLLSLTYLFNLYFSYIWITQDFRMVFPDWLVNLFVLLNFASLGMIVISLLRPKWLSLPQLSGPTFKFNAKTILLAIIAFSFLTRVFELSRPETFYFDEVYHAFTAKELLNGNSQAWEYWATPPQGFAYEWTHPPLGKLIMAGGMFVFGPNPLGWRLPGVIFGVAAVFLIYLLGKHLFKKESPALLAAALFALDGLPLIMSRIGMNDIYFLAFALLTTLLFLKERYFWSAVALGAALATKWTAFYLLIILFVAWLIFKRNVNIKYLWFLLLPPLVYLLSYTPFFTSGHTLSQWWVTQQQIWWYHTGLAAMHSYSSPWWSWPLNARPVWLFTESIGQDVANIYALGNPAIFWGGLLAVLGAIASLLKRRNKTLALLLVGYFVFFLPWALSPRIMFLYHYLPSVPFMALLLGWFLNKFWNSKPWAVSVFLLFTFSVFLFFYPHWTAIPVPKEWDSLYYWFSTWR